MSRQGCQSVEIESHMGETWQVTMGFSININTKTSCLQHQDPTAPFPSLPAHPPLYPTLPPLKLTPVPTPPAPLLASMQSEAGMQLL